MKYSILMPYHMRADQLSSTLHSFLHHYLDRDDFEVIIIEDSKNRRNGAEHNALVEVVEWFRETIPILLLQADDRNGCNASALYNLGSEFARGAFLVITNPEVMHVSNVLFGFDQEMDINPLAYVMCACFSIDKTRFMNYDASEVEGHWYQHSQHRDVQCHFCSVISKAMYDNIGGFDDAYSKGMCFDDDDFKNKIKSANIPMVSRDDLITLHLFHDKSKPSNYLELHRINKAYYERKWGKNAIRAESQRLGGLTCLKL